MSIWLGHHVADDADLRLCGDLVGKRAIELGLAIRGPHPRNCVAFARAGAKAIAVDPSDAALAQARSQAEAAEVSVQCHQGDLADLGFATSASVDLVLAANTLDGVDDLPRLLRQVHRVLKPGASFVVSMIHPVAAMFAVSAADVGSDISSVDAAGMARRAYGAAGWTISELYMSFERADFHIDALHELQDQRRRNDPAPTQLVLRARKLGV